MKLKLLTTVLVLMSLSFFTGCNQKHKTAKIKKFASVCIAPVKKETITEKLTTTGDVIASNTVTIRSTVEGIIDYCPWREGDPIKKEETLIVIDRPLYKKEVELAKAELEVAESEFKDLEYGPRKEEIDKARELVKHYKNCTHYAKIDFDRTKKLSDTGHVVSEKTEELANINYTKCKSQLEVSIKELALLEEGTKKTKLIIAESNVKKMEAKLHLAKAQLDECTIKAPFSGVVTQVYVRKGDVTSLRSGPRPPLMKIIDTSSLVVRAGLPEKSAISLKVGTAAEVKLDTYPDQIFTGKIIRIYPRIENNTRTRLVEIKLDDNINLLPNTFARVIVKGRTFKNALMIPNSAVLSTPRGESYVFIVNNNKAKKVLIKTGLETGGKVQVISGLKDKCFVVTSGNLSLKDGKNIKILNSGDAEKESDFQKGDKQ